MYRYEVIVPSPQPTNHSNWSNLMKDLVATKGRQVWRATVVQRTNNICR